MVSGLVRRHPLALALGLGLVLRLIAAQSRSLQYDDTFSFFLAQRSLPEILSGTAADTMPPLYYILLHFWMLVSQEAWYIRLLSVVLNLTSIALFYHAAKRWLGESAAGWAALLAAISPLMIYHGQDVRMYALLVACLAGYLLFFTRIWHAEGRERRADWLGLVLCAAAAMYTHNVAVFALGVPDLFLLLRRDWKRLFRLILAQTAAVVLALPWLVLIPGQIAKVQKAWTLPQPGIAEVIQAAVMFVAALPLPVPLLAVALLITLQIVVMVVMELRRLWSETEIRPGVLFFAILLLMPPALLFAASYVMQPIFVPRTFLISTLGLDALAGLVIARTWGRNVGKVIAAGFVLAALLTLPSFYTFSNFPRSPYKAMTGYLETQAGPGVRILHETKLSYFPARYYAPDLAQVFLADPEGSPNDTFEPGSQQAMQIFPQPGLEQAVKGADTVYFVTFTQTFREYQEMGLAEPPNLAWLNEHYSLAGKQTFNDLEIYRYTR